MKRKRKRIFKVFILLVLVAAGIHLIRFAFPEKEKRVRQGIYARAKSAFPEINRRVEREYGLNPFSEQALRKSASENRPCVILIHGLDEPGRVWRNLAPALEKRGARVWFMRYPDDQAIDRSARLFFDALASGPLKTVGSVSIVGHSMGGLVARQMLTDPDLDYKNCARRGDCPRVARLIMVGTPNHGSQLARFRIIMEIREQVLNLFEEEFHWAAGLFDGAGAAGIDLLPGSRFLTRLNKRPHPQGVRMTVIAGILFPWAPLPLANRVGDGLVSLSSVRLEGVTLTRVTGSHLTMIRNWSKESSRVPPAVPLILDLVFEPAQN